MSRILVVDDEPVYPMIITEYLGDDGYIIDAASDGEEAWAMMARQDYDLLIIDRMMPHLDGLGLLRRIQADPHWKTTPVILQTASAKPQQVAECIEAGACHYLTKPYEPNTLRTLVKAILSEVAEPLGQQTVPDLQAAWRLQVEGEMRCRTLNEARSIAAACAGLCTASTAVGRGLFELLANAIEHGNLGITYAEKSALRLSGGWEAEITRRLTQGPGADRQAHLRFRRAGDEIEFAIRDEGPGFDWHPYLSISPERAFDLNGHGIAITRMLGCFKTLEYRDNGNLVVVRAQAAADHQAALNGMAP